MWLSYYKNLLKLDNNIVSEPNHILHEVFEKIDTDRTHFFTFLFLAFYLKYLSNFVQSNFKKIKSPSKIIWCFWFNQRDAHYTKRFENLCFVGVGVFFFY